MNLIERLTNLLIDVLLIYSIWNMTLIPLFNIKEITILEALVIKIFVISLFLRR